MNGTRNNTLEMPKPVIIQERISRKILRAYMANFKSVADALLELVDNAFDEFDGFFSDCLNGLRFGAQDFIFCAGFDFKGHV